MSDSESEPRKANARDALVYYTFRRDTWGEDECCDNCRYWSVTNITAIDIGDGTELPLCCAQGTCQRYPPHPEHGQPTTEDLDWCGEFSQGDVTEIDSWKEFYERKVSDEKTSEERANER